MAEHQGKRLKLFIKSNDINVEQDVLPKVKMSRGTYFDLYRKQEIEPEYVSQLLKAGIDFLGQSPATRVKQNLSFTQKETGMSERVTALEAQVAELQRSLLDLYSRLPKQG